MNMEHAAWIIKGCRAFCYSYLEVSPCHFETDFYCRDFKWGKDVTWAIITTHRN